MFDYHPSIFICIHSNTGCNYFQIHAGGNKSFRGSSWNGRLEISRSWKAQNKSEKMNFESSSRGWKGQL